MRRLSIVACVALKAFMIIVSPGIVALFVMVKAKVDTEQFVSRAMINGQSGITKRFTKTRKLACDLHVIFFYGPNITLNGRR